MHWFFVIRGKLSAARWLIFAMLFFTLAAVASGLGFTSEEEKRRVDISLSIFPRVIAVDNHFREKLSSENKVLLLFLYNENKERADYLAERMTADSRNIGGMGVMASALTLDGVLKAQEQPRPTAIFLSERFNDQELDEIMAFAAAQNRLVFSPFSGDVERGATVGISVTNRVKPYFNLSALKRSKVDINALLMKMSKRYED